ncbi:MAG: sigma-54 dependent transcriptional regulator [Ignavibacterium sp.]|nr:sigma-54 dependent transcriptional regulator [Ignavibacterium sp.]
MTREEFKAKFGIISRSKEVNDIVDIAMQVAKSDISVLLYGESGVGKEVFAKAIHGYSNRADKPLISVNCGAIPEGILESELFGHKKGSFTGAVESRKGYFELADGGTLFLDEIAETPLTTQVKLLRAIENKEFMRIGSETVTKVDVRIIAATNKDLQKEVAAKKFREDLYFRLKAVTLHIPPLRERKIDIEPLTLHFINNYCQNNNIPVPKLSNEALEILINYNWPGNIRELKNTVESVLALNTDKILTDKHFHHLIIKNDEQETARNLPIFTRKLPEDVDREIIYRALFELKKDILEIKEILLKREDYEFNEKNKIVPDDDVLDIEELERNAIIKALEKTHWNKRKAAKLLNISERTLYRKIKDYDIRIW